MGDDELSGEISFTVTPEVWERARVEALVHQCCASWPEADRLEVIDHLWGG